MTDPLAELESGAFIRHAPCPACGSKDNLAVYTDHSYCFGCGYRETEGTVTKQKQEQSLGGLLTSGVYKKLGARGLNEDTCRKFKYQVGDYKGRPCHIENHYTLTGTLVAQKLRFADKTFKWLGDSKKAALGGAHLFSGGKYLSISEGALDALSMSQVQENKWPSVWLKNGVQAAAKELLDVQEWLATFDSIILMFDMDEKGRTTAEAVAKLFPYGKCRIGVMPEKDPSDCLTSGKGSALVGAFWSAQPPEVPSAVFGDDAKMRVLERPPITSYPFPSDWSELNKKSEGIRLGELDTWTSGTGMGKTTVLRQLQWHFLKTTELNQTLIHLEEPVEDTVGGIYAMEAGVRLPYLTQDHVAATHSATWGALDKEGNPRLVCKDAYMDTDDTGVFDTIRFYTGAFNSQVFWLDHLSMMVSDMDQEGDERRRIDYLMHGLKRLTKELGIYIGLVVHLNNSVQKGPTFEEGGVPSLNNLRGSGGIKQLSNSVYALSRNQQAETDQERNTSTIHVLKARHLGKTGKADSLIYDQDTGRLSRLSEDFADDEFNKEDSDGAF